jgi:alkylmercury lyase
VTQTDIADQRREIKNGVLQSVVALRPIENEAEQVFALALYQLLAKGKPVRREELAAILNRPSSEVWGTLSNWPSLIEWDDNRRVMGFAGLTLEPTRHRLITDGVTLFAWCAWDTLFIPTILGVTANVESTCPETGRAISLTVSASGVTHAEPSGVVMSFPHTTLAAMNENVRANFCQHVFFFSSIEDGTAWTNRTPGTIVLNLEEAFELGVRKNALQFGALLDSPQTDVDGSPTRGVR